jgi:hypothetical protein
MIWNKFFNGWEVVQVETCHWVHYYWYWLDNFCQHIMWKPLLKVVQQNESYSSYCKGGQILGYLCQFCAHGGNNLRVIEGIWWQTTLHGEGMASHENIETTCLITMRCTIWITIKPCKCD